MLLEYLTSEPASDEMRPKMSFTNEFMMDIAFLETPAREHVGRSAHSGPGQARAEGGLRDGGRKAGGAGGRPGAPGREPARAGVAPVSGCTCFRTL